MNTRQFKRQVLKPFAKVHGYETIQDVPQSNPATLMRAVLSVSGGLVFGSFVASFGAFGIMALGAIVIVAMPVMVLMTFLNGSEHKLFRRYKSRQCLRCTYDLSGIPGEHREVAGLGPPVRTCPECGAINPMPVAAGP